MNRRGFLKALVAGALGLCLGSAKPKSASSGVRPTILHPRWTSRSYELHDTVMTVPREPYRVEFFTYEGLGGCLGHKSAISKVPFA